MVCLLEQFSGIWSEETVPKQWREGLIVNLFKKGDNRGITLLSVVGKVFCKILNHLLVQCLEHCMKGRLALELHRSCMDNVYTSNEIVQGRFRETCFLFRCTESK